MAITSSSLISSSPSPPSSTALMIASSCSFVIMVFFSFVFGWGHGDQATALCSCFLRSSSSSFFESVSNCEVVIPRSLLFKFLGYSVFGDTPIGPFVRRAVGAQPRASPPGGVSGFFIFRLWETLVAERMFLFWGRRNSMTKSAPIAVAVALLLGGTSLATAKNRGAAGTHRHPSHPGINETTPQRARGPVSPDTPETSRPANPYYRLSDQYYDYSDPYHGLFNFYAVPPYVPGYTYRHMRMPPR
jgi:hypothetical protein